MCCRYRLLNHFKIGHWKPQIKFLFSGYPPNFSYWSSAVLLCFILLHFSWNRRKKKTPCVCHLNIISSLLISCIPVSALMVIIYSLSSDNKMNSIIYDPWLGHWSLGILKKYFFFSFIFSVKIKRALKRHAFIHSIIHLLIWSGNQSVS